VTELDEAALHTDLDVRPWNDPDPEVSLRPGRTARRWALLSQRESDPRLRGRSHHRPCSSNNVSGLPEPGACPCDPDRLPVV